MRGGRQIAGNPVLIGAATVLVVLVAVFLAYNANQGLPFVPTYNLNAELPSAANLVRGNEVRIGGTRVGSIDRIGVERRRGRRRTSALLSLKLERSVDPLPVDSTLIVRPRSALGLKYVADRARDVGRGLRGRRHDPARASHPGAGRVRRVPEHVRRGDARGRAREPQRVRRRARRPRREPQPGDRRVPPAAARHHPGRRATSPARRPTCRGSIRSLARRPRSSRPPPSRRRSCSSTSTRRSARCARSRRSSRSRSPRGRRRSTRGSAEFPLQRPFLANTAALFRGAPAGRRRAAHRRAGPRRHGRGRHAGAAPQPAVQRPARHAARGGRGVRDRPARAAGHRPADRRRWSCSSRRCEFVGAGADDLQLPRAVRPQRRVAALRGRRQRHLAAVHHRRHAAGPEQRGRAVVGARERADGRQPPARQQLPEHGGAGPAEGVRGGQRDLPRGPHGDRQRRPAPSRRPRRASPDGRPPPPHAAPEPVRRRR